MADVHHFLLGAVVMVMMLLSAVHTHECDCSKVIACSQFRVNAEACLQPLMTPPTVGPMPEPQVLCQLYEGAKMCMAGLSETCSDPPPGAQQALSMWRDMSVTASAMCGATTPGGDPCQQFEVNALQCMLRLQELGNDMDQFCTLFGETKACMDNVTATCPNPPPAGNATLQMWRGMTPQAEMMCGNTETPCSQFGTKVQICMAPFQDVSSSSDICGVYREAETCMAPLLEANCSAELLSGWNQLTEAASMMCSTPSTPAPSTTPSTSIDSCSNFEDEAGLCFTDITNGSGPGSTNEQVCRLFRELQLCIDPFFAACPEEAAGSHTSWVYDTIQSQIRNGYNC